MKTRIKFDADLLKIVSFLRTNGPATKEQIEAAGLKLTNAALAQGDFWGLLVWVEPLNMYA